MKDNYAALLAKPEFQALRASVPEQLATWDDHDYCRNDAGAECALRKESQV